MSQPSDIRGGLSGPKVNVTLQAMQETRADETAELQSEQLSSKIAFQASCEEQINPFQRLQRQQKPIDANRARFQKMLKLAGQASRLSPIEMIKESADQFHKRNPELKVAALISLKDLIKPGDTKEEILRKIREFYPDVSLMDEVLEFLLETTQGDLASTLQDAREALNNESEREIIAGRNIGPDARAASEKGLGAPTDLRNMYRDITGNPRDSTTLFQELSQKYEFTELKEVTDFLLHSLGSDMKSKGPSIPRGQLHRLITETRSLQAILGVYRFFKGRMPLIDKLFEKEGLDKPPELNFETMAKQFMTLTGERYPSSEKVLQTAVRLGIDKWITAKIIAFSQFRDGIREVALNQIYRSLQHRDELYLAILEALEDLEDELEDLLQDEGDEETGEEDSENEGKENKG